MVNVKKWVTDHSTLLSADEQQIVAGLDKVVEQTEYYFQLQELRKDPKELQASIIVQMEELVKKVNRAMESLKNNLARPSRFQSNTLETNSDEDELLD